MIVVDFSNYEILNNKKNLFSDVFKNTYKNKLNYTILNILKFFIKSGIVDLKNKLQLQKDLLIFCKILNTFRNNIISFCEIFRLIYLFKNNYLFQKKNITHKFNLYLIIKIEEF